MLLDTPTGSKSAEIVLHNYKLILRHGQPCRKKRSFEKLITGEAGDFEQGIKDFVAEIRGLILEDDTKGTQCLWRLAKIFASTRPISHVPIIDAKYEANRIFVSAILANELVFSAMVKYQSKNQRNLLLGPHLGDGTLALANRGKEAALESALQDGADPNQYADDVSVLLIALSPNENVRTQTRLKIAKHLLDPKKLIPYNVFNDLYRFLCEKEGSRNSQARKQKMLRGLTEMNSFCTIFQEEDQTDSRGGFLQRICTKGAQYSIVLPVLPWLLQTFLTLRPPTYGGVFEFLVASWTNQADKRNMLLTLAKLRSFSEALRIGDAIYASGGFLQSILLENAMAYCDVLPVLPLLLQTFPTLRPPAYGSVCQFLVAPYTRQVSKDKSSDNE
eukprot:g65196.t1